MELLKQQIHALCGQILNERLAALCAQLQDLADSAAAETKSSAGDKYETTRAMLHIEQDGVRRQIAVSMAQQAVLDAIDPMLHSPRIMAGSLVLLDGTYYYLSIALGKLQIAERTVYVLSLQSPLGSALKSLKTGDTAMANGRQHLIGGVV